MWLIDLDKKVVHDMGRPQYECQITKIPKDRRRKIHTKDGMERFLEDRLNKEYHACQHCMPDYFTFDMSSIFK